MATEFKIFFSYNNCNYRARVVRSMTGNDELAYAIRPLSLTLAKGYGPQTLIYKKDGRYSCHCQVNETTPDYVKALVSALETQDDTKMAMGPGEQW